MMLPEYIDTGRFLGFLVGMALAAIGIWRAIFGAGWAWRLFQEGYYSISEAEERDKNTRAMGLAVAIVGILVMSYSWPR